MSAVKLPLINMLFCNNRLIITFLKIIKGFFFASVWFSLFQGKNPRLLWNFEPWFMGLMGLPWLKKSFSSFNHENPGSNFYILTLISVSSVPLCIILFCLICVHLYLFLHSQILHGNYIVLSTENLNIHGTAYSRE